MCTLLNHRSTYHIATFGSVEKCPSNAIICIIHFYVKNSEILKSAVFEVLTTVVMKCSIFWDTIQCSPL